MSVRILSVWNQHRVVATEHRRRERDCHDNQEESLLLVNLDGPVLHDDLGLLIGHCILEPVPDEENDRNALPELVGTSGRTRGELPREFVKHPVLGR